MLSLTAFASDAFQSDAFQIETGRITVTIRDRFAAGGPLIEKRPHRDRRREQLLREDEELMMVVSAAVATLSRTRH